MARFDRNVAARKASALFWKTHDTDVLAAVCDLIRSHGLRAVSKAAQTIAKLPTSSSRRAFEYLKELLELKAIIS